MEINWSRRGYTQKEFIQAWNTSLSVAQVLVKLGKVPRGGNYKVAKATAKTLGLSDSHMTGQGWNTGDRFRSFTPKMELSAILVEESTYKSTYSLKLRLIKEGLLEEICSECKLTEWMGKPIPLALDHINGVNNDNRLENLRLLCHNCHGQTSTYCGKNKGTYRVQLDS